MALGSKARALRSAAGERVQAQPRPAMASAGARQDPEPLLDLNCKMPPRARSPADAPSVHLGWRASTLKFALRDAAHFCATLGAGDLGCANVERALQLSGPA